MICPQCQYDAPSAFSFCPQCGAQLQRTCPHCGFQVPAEFAFCPKCGTAVQAGSAEARQQEASAAFQQAAAKLMPKELADRLMTNRGRVSSERRQVAILFCDIKGSTAMAESLDPEDMLDVINGAFEFLIPPIYRYEGTLTQLLGDAILAFFGAPIAHEDDPERAIRAALDIVAGARDYGEQLQKEKGIPGFAVRVGIHTGRVIVGEVGSDLRVAYTAVGDAINLAARMEQNAPPGGILITHDTYGHVRGVFDVLPQEPLSVKGKASPVQTYLVQQAKPRAFRTPTRGVEGVETRTVGREAELLALQNLFRDAVEERESRVVTIVGEAGVGKSRLLYEFDNWMELRPEHCFYFKGRATAVTQAVPNYLIRNMLAYRFDILESDPAAIALAKFRSGMAGVLAPERADVVGQLVGFDFQAAGSAAAKSLLGSESFPEVATAYLVQYVRGLASQQPLVILLEDLQWADDSSLDLVARLVSERPAAPMVVVAAARPSLFERRPNWGEGQRAYSRLDLKPLSRRAMRELVGEILQRVPEIPEALRQLVVDGCEGNPFYAEELVKMLLDEGVVLRAEDHWQVALDRLGQVRVPPTLTGVLQARLDALPPTEKAVLQRAAVVGRLFWDILVRELSSDAPEPVPLAAALAALRQREMIFRHERSAFAGAEEYIFQHSILRDVTYETVLLRLRRKYHGQIAQWIEAHSGERLSEYLAVIATHYELAGALPRAAWYWQRSGDEALRSGAMHDARAAFERALRLLPAGPTDDEAGETAENEAPSTMAGGPPPSARLRAHVLVHLGQAIGWLGDPDASGARLQEGLALARVAGDRRIELAALAGLGRWAANAGRFDEAQRVLDQARALAQVCGDDQGLADALQQLARLSWQRGHYDEAEHCAEQSGALYRQLGDRHQVGWLLNVLGIVALNSARYDQATRYFNETLAVAQETGDRLMAATALNNVGEMARNQGHSEQARVSYEQSRAIGAELGLGLRVAMADLNLALVSLDQGRVEESEERARSALLVFRDAHSPMRQVSCLLAFARLREARGQLEPAADLLGLLMRHPAADAEDRAEGELLFARLRQSLPAAQMEAALARGAAMDMDKVVQELLGQDG